MSFSIVTGVGASSHADVDRRDPLWAGVEVETALSLGDGETLVLLKRQSPPLTESALARANPELVERGRAFYCRQDVCHQLAVEAAGVTNGGLSLRFLNSNGSVTELRRDREGSSSISCESGESKPLSGLSQERINALTNRFRQPRPSGFELRPMPPRRETKGVFRSPDGVLFYVDYDNSSRTYRLFEGRPGAMREQRVLSHREDGSRRSPHRLMLENQRSLRLPSSFGSTGPILTFGSVELRLEPPANPPRNTELTVVASQDLRALRINDVPPGLPSLVTPCAPNGVAPSSAPPAAALPSGRTGRGGAGARPVNR